MLILQPEITYSHLNWTIYFSELLHGRRQHYTDAPVDTCTPKPSVPARSALAPSYLHHTLRMSQSERQSPFFAPPLPHTFPERTGHLTLTLSEAVGGVLSG